MTPEPKSNLLKRLEATGEVECSLCERPVVFGFVNPDGPEAAGAIRVLAAALEGLESACDAVAATRSQETYLRMIDEDGAKDALSGLHDARTAARQALLSLNKEGKS